MKLRNQWEFKARGQKFTKPSMTIPDQTLSIKEIISRYVRGLPIDGEKVPIYDGEEDDMPDPRTLDLSELAELDRASKSTIENYQSDLNKYKDNQFKKRMYEDYKKELEKASPPAQSDKTEKPPAGDTHREKLA